MSLHRITLTAVVELPDGDERLELYGRDNAADCIQLDFDNDPAMFLMEQADEMVLIYDGVVD